MGNKYRPKSGGQWLNLAGTGRNGIPQPVFNHLKWSLHHMAMSLCEIIQFIEKWIRLDGLRCIFWSAAFQENH